MRLFRLPAFRLVLLGVTFLSVQGSADEKRPNILFVFADDWGWGDLSRHGHPYVKTPLGFLRGDA